MPDAAEFATVPRSTMQSLAARQLLRTRVSTPLESRPTRVVLPFFTRRLDVRFVLVLLDTGDLRVIHDPPSRVTPRELRYEFTPRQEVDLRTMQASEFEPLLHFDPWWLLRDRRDVDEKVRATIVGSNIAAARIDGRPITSVHFDHDLMRVVDVTTPRRLAGRRVIGADELVRLLDV